MAIFGETSLQQLLDDTRIEKLQSYRAREVSSRLSFPPSLSGDIDAGISPYTGDGAEALATAVRQLLSALSWSPKMRYKVVVNAHYYLKPTAAALFDRYAQPSDSWRTQAQMLVHNGTATLTLYLTHRPRIQVVLSPHSTELYLRIAYPELRGFFSPEVPTEPVYICLKGHFRHQKYFWFDTQFLVHPPDCFEPEETPTSPTDLVPAVRGAQVEKIEGRQKAKKELQLARARKSKQRDLSRKAESARCH